MQEVSNSARADLNGLQINIKIDNKKSIHGHYTPHYNYLIKAEKGNHSQVFFKKLAEEVLNLEGLVMVTITIAIKTF